MAKPKNVARQDTHVQIPNQRHFKFETNTPNDHYYEPGGDQFSSSDEDENNKNQGKKSIGNTKSDKEVNTSGIGIRNAENSESEGDNQSSEEESEWEMPKRRGEKVLEDEESNKNEMSESDEKEESGKKQIYLIRKKVKVRKQISVCPKPMIKAKRFQILPTLKQQQ